MRLLHPFLNFLSNDVDSMWCGFQEDDGEMLSYIESINTANLREVVEMWS
jgi:hypothetical protein